MNRVNKGGVLTGRPSATATWVWNPTEVTDEDGEFFSLKRVSKSHQRGFADWVAGSECGQGLPAAS